MSYQYIHEECYAREAGKTKTGGHNAQSIMDEVNRKQGACPHVAEPQKPKPVFGISPDEVLAMATVWGNNSTDEIGRKLRKDAPIIIAGVFSVDDEMPQDQWNRYKQDTVSYLKGKYGGRLKSVVEHTDEAFRHCHYYVVPLAGEKFDSIHSGKSRARQAKIAKLSKGEQNAAYVDGMRAFQDDFFLKVGSRYGQLRFGPKRARMTRAGWVQSKAKAKAKIDAMVKETRQKIYDEARLQGYNDGLAEGIQSATSLGNKLGAFVATATKNAVKQWHKPTIEAYTQVQKIKTTATKYVAGERKKAVALVVEADNIAKGLRDELEKERRISQSYAKDNELLSREIKEILPYINEKHRSLPLVINNIDSYRWK
ncbi:hypothetical protein [Xylophilus ampelinus]|uniref:Plasmid recombination enzyme n=1 Tax=Xylophilus ampelinus TaxID=54067 RepID=A0A318SLJ2_9BURK|nr:hypothetical protein [Xylophilus ampelinus]MCS4510379.1 plasmid recombination protein [Xylophilus ampelinus]PYE77998.1 hypothetical protein DFQ15_11022 [Xylophilus ampelinus]